MQGTLGFTITGEYLTGFLRQLWVELEHKKILDVLEGIPELSPVLMRGLCSGIYKAVEDEEGNMSLVDDTAKECCGISIETYDIRRRFDQKLYDLLDAFQCYSIGSSRAYDEDEVQHYLDLSLTAASDIKDLEENFKAFLTLTKDFDSSKSFTSLDKDKIRNQIKIDRELQAQRDRYENKMSEYLYKLDFDLKHTVDELIDSGKIQAIQLMQIDHTNGLNYLESHRNAQEEMDELRANDIHPENILETIWNSGWLAPDGRFYGCPDLSHKEFSEKLYSMKGYLKLGLDKEITRFGHDIDEVFEKNHWVKFSSGRWLYYGQSSYLDEEEKWRPTKKQYEVILAWAKERSDRIKIVLGDDTQYVNLDIVECQKNSVTE